MIEIIKMYKSLASDIYYSGNNLKMRRNYLYIPFGISSLLFYIIGFDNIIIIFKGSSQELINAFTIISGFLLTSISILLATTDIKKVNFDKIRKNLGITLKKSKNKNEDEDKKFLEESNEKVIEYIDNIKKTLLYEIVIQFLVIIIITILIAVIKNYTEDNNLIIYMILTFITTTLGILSFYLMTKLLRNFLKFQNFTSFKIENK